MCHRARFFVLVTVLKNPEKIKTIISVGVKAKENQDKVPTLY